jgi:hypothetical protein
LHEDEAQFGGGFEDEFAVGAEALEEANEVFNSISGFASMADRQNHNLFPVVVIQGDVGPLPEFNYPLAKLWRQLFDRTANLQVLAERFHTLPDRLDGALCGFPAFGSQKLMETGHIQQGRLGPP